MPRTMYDAIDVSNLPPGGDLYAGYVDGRWPDANAISERFPGKLVVRIATSPATNDGVVGDGPPDNGTWPEWVDWTSRRRAAGVDPSINTDLALWAEGKTAFQAAGVPEPHWWIADYDGNPAIMPGAVSKQYASNNAYDTSSVADHWPGVDPAPTPTPSPAVQEDEMFETIRPLTLHVDEYAYGFKAGKYTKMQLGCDGYGATAELRVVVWGGGDSVLQVKIGGKTNTPADRQRVIDLPSGTWQVTVRREDAESFPVSVDFS